MGLIDHAYSLSLPQMVTVGPWGLKWLAGQLFWA